MRRELELLWEFHGRRLDARIPPERLADRLAFTQRPPLRLAWCAACELTWRNPAERDVEVRDSYAGELPPHDVLDALHAAQRATYRAQARRLERFHGRPGTVLEVGSYVGGFLAAAAQRGWTATGVDVNAHTNAYSRGLGLDVIDGELSTVESDASWDAIAVWNCLDQLPDPRATVGDAKRRLRLGGTFAARVPNGGTYARLRQRAAAEGRRGTVARAVLAHNNLLGFPYRWGFTPRSLSAMLQASGFEIVHVEGDVLVATSDEWTRRWARAEERVAKAMMRSYARRRPDRAPWFEIYARKTHE